MNRYSNKRRGIVRQLATHTEEDNRENEFLETKILMDFIVDLQSILKDTNDESMRQQMTAAKNDLKSRIRKLTQDGYALPQLYSKFGANILRAQIIDANETIANANREGEYRIADLLDEDRIIQKFAPEKVGERQNQLETLRYAGFNLSGLNSDIIEKLMKSTGSENIDELNARIEASANTQQEHFAEVDDLKRIQDDQRAEAIQNRVAYDAQKRLGLAMREQKKKKIRDDTAAVAMMDLPVDSDDDEEEEKVVPQQVMQQLAAADPAATIMRRKRQRADTEIEDDRTSPMMMIQEEKKDRPVFMIKEDDRSLATMSTRASTLKESVKGLSEPDRKKMVSAAVKGVGIDLKMTKTGNQVSYQSKHRETNIKRLNNALFTAKTDDDRKKIQDIIDVYQY